MHWIDETAATCKVVFLTTPDSLNSKTQSVQERCFPTICAFGQVDKNRPEFVQDRLLVGNNDEITGLCWVGASGDPSHVVVASNSEHIRIFDAESLNCTTTMAGHTGTVLCLAIRQLEDGRAVVVSGEL